MSLRLENNDNPLSFLPQFYGIDISKDVFDVVDASGKHHQFKNDLSGFKEFGKMLNRFSSQQALKQSLAIAKSGLYYDENYRSVNVNLG